MSLDMASPLPFLLLYMDHILLRPHDKHLRILNDLLYDEYEE